MEWRRRRPLCLSLLWPNVKIDPSHSHLFFLVEQTLVWAQNLGFHPKLREYPNSVSRRACPKRSPTCGCMQSNQPENSIIIPSTGLEFFLGSSDGRGWLLASQSAWTRLRLSWVRWQQKCYVWNHSSNNTVAVHSRLLHSFYRLKKFRVST